MLLCLTKPLTRQKKRRIEIGEPLIENASKSLLKLQSLAGGHEWECFGVMVHQDPEE